METYKGIDYSLGQSNFEAKTGIHYGVISQNSVASYFFDDVEYDYGKPTCPDCENELPDDIPDDMPDDIDCIVDYYCPDCKKGFSSDYVFPEEPFGWHYKNEQYTLTDCLDTDIFILKSPFFTYAQFCSPCVPGAGNLDCPCESGPKTYCLGPDYFEDGKAPYPVYSIETGKRID
jgi:hypothetical protein